MIVIFYKDGCGQITGHQKAPTGYTEQEIAEKIEEFNDEKKKIRAGRPYTQISLTAA